MTVDLISVRRKLHQEPELSFEEYNTQKVIIECLENMGLTPVAFGKTGVYVDIGQGECKKIKALRVDIDALPMEEDEGNLYRSHIAGKAHMCGHDIHTAIGLGTAQELIRRKQDWNEKIRIIFQPGEESLMGSRCVVEAGVLNGVTKLWGFHNKPELKVGQVAFCKNAVMAASGRFKIVVYGKGGHGAAPHTTNDAVVAIGQIITALQTIVSRNVNPLESAVISVCKVEVGKTFNVIPAEGYIEGTVRFLSKEMEIFLQERIKQVAGFTAQSFGCRIVFEYEEQVPVLVSTPELQKQTQKVTEELLGRENVLTIEGTMTSEDFSLYGKYMDICYFYLGSEGKYAYHHPCFAADERCIDVGVMLLAGLLENECIEV